jgi:flagellar biosynthesis/type III secretory pathway ATPase
VAGSNPRVDLAIARIGAIRAFLRQGIYEKTTFEEAEKALMGLG